jgi:spermidine synthase
MPKSDKVPLDLIIIAFVSGACTMVVEIAGARVISPYLGNTIYTWASAIGLVLAALSAGYYAGGILADRYHDRKHFSIILLAAGILTLTVPILGNIITPFTLLLELSTANLVAALVLVPASFFFGMVSPYVIKLTSKVGHEGQGAGRIFAISTIGSIIGSLGTGFILIPNLEVTFIFILASISMVLMSWLSFPKKGMLLDIVPVAFMVFLTLQVGYANPWEGETIYEGDSMYYHILVLDGKIDGAPARMILLDNALSTAEDSDGGLILDYAIKSRIGYELAVDVKNALVLGIAGGSQIEDLKKHFPEAHVDGVDIDSKVIEIGKTYFSLEDDERTDLIVDDARRYVKTTDNVYDLVLLDAFRGRSIPPHLTTQEFLYELKNRMSPDGVVIVNIISSLEGDDADVFIFVYNTFSSVFKNVLVFHIEDDPETLMNIIIIATDKDASQFLEEHSEEVYSVPVPERAPLTDELNPIELYSAH